jgi:hypothetical protein
MMKSSTGSFGRLTAIAFMVNSVLAKISQAQRGVLHSKRQYRRTVRAFSPEICGSRQLAGDARYSWPVRNGGRQNTVPL